MGLLRETLITEAQKLPFDGISTFLVTDSLSDELQAL